MKPMYITVDGVDGSGKSTAVHYIKQLLEKRGRKVRVVKGMGEGKLGAVVRQHLLDHYLDDKLVATACGLALLDCYKHAQEYLEQGYDVIADRSIATYYAYNVRGNEDPGAVEIFHHILNNPDLVQVQPDLLIMADVDLRIAKERLTTRPEELTHIDERSLEYFQEVSNGYYDFFERANNNKQNIRVINNDNDIDCFKQLLLATINSLYSK